MEGVFLLLIFVGVVFLAPIVLSIVAIVQASRARGEVERLRRLVGASGPAAAPAAAVPAAAPPIVPPPSTPPSRPVAVDAVPGVTRPPPLPPPPPRPAAAPRDAGPAGPGLESQLGGRVAAFAGIAALVVGVVFFVGYAIQHNWIGPAVRVTLGLLAGAALVAAGHGLHVRSARHGLLARVLTGGGAALFYFSVFAAGGIYDLIGPGATVAGLAATAAAVLALSALYDSQFIAVMALLGAFVAPPLVQHEEPDGLFLLFFAAAVNLPVIALGLKRRWQWLYNLAFFFTTIVSAAAFLGELDGLEDDCWGTRVFFAALFFGEFAALSLVKLVRETERRGRALDYLRLSAATLVLLGLLYLALEAGDRHHLVAPAFLLTALALAGLSSFARRRLPAFTDEALALLLGALTFASLALPAHLEGPWVSLGWAMEGVFVMWFAVRVDSATLRAAAVVLGAIGLMRPALLDAGAYDPPPPIFFNARFAVGLAAAAAFGAQGWLAGRRPAAEAEERPADRPGGWSEGCWMVVPFGFAVAMMAETLAWMELDDPFALAVGTWALAAAGVAAAWAARRGPGRPLAWLGALMMALAVLKLVFVDLIGADYDPRWVGPFGHAPFWSRVGMSILIAIAARATSGDTSRATALTIGALVALILSVSAEVARLADGWDSSLITIWWAASALALVGAGLWRRMASLRWLAFAVFGAMMVKVFVADIAGLEGLPRVAAFVGAGLALLIVAYVYQRVAPHFLGAGRPGGAR